MFVPKCLNWKYLFVSESNLIDPQPGYKGNEEGCLMFDNHMSALNFAISDGWELNENTPLDLHRFLTRGIPFFEDYGMSGKYRNVDVWIGHESCPSPVVLNNLMNAWYKITKHLMDRYVDKKDFRLSALEIAFISHHVFEVIHPFIDGNGRTGRLLVAKVLHDLGQEPVIVKFSDRHDYYQTIQDFRDKYWTGTQFHFVEFYQILGKIISLS
jgi:Fic family protein